MKKVLINVSSKEDYFFIRKLHDYFEARNLEVDIICTNIIVFAYLLLKGEKPLLAKQVEVKNGGLDINVSEYIKFNVESGSAPKEDAIRSLFGFDKFLREYIERYDVDLMVIPSGRMLSQKIMKHHATRLGIKTLFIGYGNVPGKTFLDAEGTDRDSKLFNEIHLLHDFCVDSANFLGWRNSYLQEKLKVHHVPQSRTRNVGFIIKRTIRTLIGKIESIGSIAHDINYSFDSSLYSGNKTNYNFSTLPDKYIFFPMQLSSDAQIILNYEGDIYTAMNHAVDIAESMSVPLVVKPHPAEVSPIVSDYLSSMRASGKIVITNDNTFTVIQGASEIITVNSTVGLESRLLGKPVRFLGDSLFERIPEHLLGAYLLGYLFDLDYFDDSSLRVELYPKLDTIIGY